MTHGSLRRCLGPERVADRGPGQKKVESRGISTTLRQGWWCRPKDECVFGASPALSQTLRGRPTRRLGSIAATLAFSSTPSQVNAFCLVLSDSSDRMSKALAQKGELVQSGGLRCLAIDYCDDTFNVAQDQKLFLVPRVSLLWEQPCSHDRLLLKKVQRIWLWINACLFHRGENGLPCSLLVDTHALARVGTSLTVCSWSHRPHVWFGGVNANGIGPPQFLSARNHMLMCCPHPTERSSCPASCSHGLCSPVSLVSCPVSSRKMILSAGSSVSSWKENMGGRIIEGGRRRLIIPCQSFFSSSSHDISVRGSPHGLQWAAKCIITTRLLRFVSPGCFSTVALLIFPKCSKVGACFFPEEEFKLFGHSRGDCCF